MKHSRRRFLSACGVAACAGLSLRPNMPSAQAGSNKRQFHVCMCPEGLDADPERLALFRECGVDAVWVGAFFYGYWPVPPESIATWLERIRATGMAAHSATIPLGHPGDSLGSGSESFPLTPGKTWRMAMRPDGTQYSGTSLHPPATEENCAALRQLQAMNSRRVFLDDDFRLATGPGVIGGCFCPDHKSAFLRLHNYPEARWEELLGDVQARNLTALLRAWVEYTCDGLTASFRAQQAAAPELELGIMVMYFGAEKAGIRLNDYKNALLRVGELMFDDASFSKTKNKTAELFSVLFHRRFVTPERAFSETTAYPADQLSARNMAAKLIISTIADVRNSMMMSGVRPFPREHWSVLAPAMKIQAAWHEKLAGHIPRGPLKHYWGEWSRYVGKDEPFSLFLAMGVPFEVTEAPAKDGWTFLSDADAQGLAAGQIERNGTTFITRPAAPGTERKLEESLDALFSLKREIALHLNDVPHVEEDLPVVCAWYPTARAVLLWNLSEEKINFTLRLGETRRTVEIPGLESALLEDVG